MEKNSFEEAVGFEMNNLKNFPFSRLPIGPQLEVIDELRVKEKMELFNVNSGFRGYFARNGPLGRHVDWIGTSLEVHLNEHRNAVYHVVRKGRFGLAPDLRYKQRKLLLRKIRSCEKFSTGCGYLPRKNPFISDEETTNYLADCLRNLGMVSRLEAAYLGVSILRKVLAALHFEVTDWAELRFLDISDQKNLSGHAEFLKSYLGKQLKNCKKVGIIRWPEMGKVLEEIPGFQLEEDPTRVQEIVKAFQNDGKVYFNDSWDSGIKFYRRKIGEDKQGFVVVANHVQYM